MKTEKVITSAEDRKQIAEALGISKYVISKELNFNADSMTARRVRIYAVNTLGCRAYVKQKHLI